METDYNEFISIITQTISFEYITGSDKRKYEPHITNWRNFPFTVIVYVSDGLYFCEVKDKCKLYIKSGNAVIIPPGIIHRVGMDKMSILSFAHIHFTILQNFDILSLYNVPLVIENSYSEKISIILDSLFIHKSKSNDHFLKEIVKVRAQGFLLLYTILEISEFKNSSTLQLSKVKRIYPVIKYIEDNLKNSLTRSELARILSISETKFHNVLKEAIGVSPMEYVRNLRLSKAQLLLITTDLPIAFIGEEVGYPDLYNFSKIFKNSFGISPLKYRQGYKNQKLYM
jgi:AraC family transcriptional regulator of arabinose operon